MPDTRQTSMQTLATLCLAVVIIIWSYHWIVLKSLTPYIGAFDLTALRCVVGAVMIFVVMRIKGISLKPPSLLPTLIIGLLQTVGMNGLSQLALLQGGAGKVAVLTYTMPFWVLLLGVPLLKEHLKRYQYGVLLLAATGVVLVLEPWSAGASLMSAVLAILAGLSWALGTIMMKKMLLRHHEINLLSLTGWQMLLGSAVLAAIAVMTHDQPIIWNRLVVEGLAYCAFLATALAWVLWTYALKNLSVGVAGMSMLAIPILGMAFSWVIFGEQLDFSAMVGVLLISLALVAMRSGFQKILLRASRQGRKLKFYVAKMVLSH